MKKSINEPLLIVSVRQTFTFMTGGGGGGDSRHGFQGSCLHGG